MSNLIYIITEVDPINRLKIEALSLHNTVFVWETQNYDKDYAWNNKHKKHRIIDLVRFIIASKFRFYLITCGYLPFSNLLWYLILSPFAKLKILHVDSTEQSTTGNWYNVKKLILKSFDYFIVSGIGAKSYLRKYKISDEKIYSPLNVYKYPINHTGFFEEESVIVAARDIPEKNLEYAERLAAEVDVKFYFYGKKSGSTNSTYHAFVDHNQLMKHISSAKILLLPSLKETWGHVVCEAIIHGTIPVVSRNVGCYRDIIAPVENETGFKLSFSPLSYQEGVDVLKSALQLDDMTYSKLLLQLSEKIENYTVDNYLTAYDQITHRH